MPMSADLAAKITKGLDALTEPAARVFCAAVVVLRHYLGQDFIQQRIALSDKPDVFILNDVNGDNDTRLAHMRRVAELAEFVLALDGSAGFDVLLGRFLRPQLQPTFAEAEAAATFKQHGFTVEIKRETGERGADFDFVAMKDGQPINIEVTAAMTAEFRSQSVTNLLQGKRSQVPDDAPAGLYVLIPLSWFKDGLNVQQELTTVTQAFFRGSRRFNFVCYVWHAFQQGNGASVHATVKYPILNDGARHRPPDLSLLTFETPKAGGVREALGSGAPLAADPELYYDFMAAWKAHAQAR
jgi:hypothetical protein